MKPSWALPPEDTSFSQQHLGAEDKTGDCGQLLGGLRSGSQLRDGTVANARVSGPTHIIPIRAHTADPPLHWASYITPPLFKSRFPGGAASITMTVRWFGSRVFYGPIHFSTEKKKKDQFNSNFCPVPSSRKKLGTGK